MLTEVFVDVTCWNATQRHGATHNTWMTRLNVGVLQ